jgi:REP element-mobilizing transposase RayT
MSRPYAINDASKAHFITATVVDWIDVFTRKSYCDILEENLNFYIKNRGLIVYGYVIMSNHIHVIIQAKNLDLSEVLRDFKKFTAKQILNTIQTETESRRSWMLERFKKATETHHRNKTYQFWSYGNHAEDIFSEKFLWSKLDYIHFNPVRAGIVKRPQDYLWSSAGNYIEGKGNVQVTLADNPVRDTTNLSNISKMSGYD